MLWHKVKKGLSAGRVQSVAVRLVVDREREIDAFQAEEYWTVEALLRKQEVIKGRRDELVASSWSATGSAWS